MTATKRIKVDQEIMSLTFSAKPGPRERQLQRKLNNPFFSATAPLTQATIQIAQQQDQIALEKFTARFRDLVQRAANLDKNVESEVILLLKAQLEQQYTLCTGLPGQPATICDAIKKLIITIIATLRDTSKNDPHALEKLATDEEHSMLHLQLCEHQIVSDILNPDVIIPEHEQTPTLLNESGDALQAALTLFPPERIKVMIDEGKALLKNIESGGNRVSAACRASPDSFSRVGVCSCSGMITSGLSMSDTI